MDPVLLKNPESLEYIKSIHGDWENTKNYPCQACLIGNKKTIGEFCKKCNRHRATKRRQINFLCWELLRRNKQYQQKFHYVMNEIKFLRSSKISTDELKLRESILDDDFFSLFFQHDSRSPKKVQSTMFRQQICPLTKLNPHSQIIRFDEDLIKPLTILSDKNKKLDSNHQLYQADDYIDDTKQVFMAKKSFLINAPQEAIISEFKKFLNKYRKENKGIKKIENDYEIILGLRLYDALESKKYKLHKETVFNIFIKIDPDLEKKHKRSTLSEKDFKASVNEELKEKKKSLLSKIEKFIRNPGLYAERNLK